MKKIVLFITFVMSFAFYSATSFAVDYIETIPSTVLLDVVDSEGNYGWGSGFFISTDAYILTNAHVVMDPYTGLPADYINICTIADEYSMPECLYSGYTVAYDTDYDLALVVPAYAIDDEGNEYGEWIDGNEIEHSYVDFSDSLPSIGDDLMILGFPSASMLSSITLTQGSVSGFSFDGTGEYIWEIATDATINPGNSGGPAHNEDERVVGVVTAISLDGVGGNYGYVISNEIIEYWFYSLVDEDILNPDFVSEIFSNDEWYTDYEGELEDLEFEEGNEGFVYTEAGPFTDVGIEHPYYEAINFLKNMEVISGHPDGSFKPQDELNRAELLKILIEANWGTPDAEVYKNCFPDVEEEWFSKYVCFAKERDYVNGYLDGTFRPSRSVNKAEAIKMMFEIYDLNTSTAVKADVYIDVVEGDWFEPYIKTAKDMGLLEEDGMYYYPNKAILREQVSENLFRLMTFDAAG